jgi:hypothetical protein
VFDHLLSAVPSWFCHTLDCCLLLGCALSGNVRTIINKKNEN